MSAALQAEIERRVLLKFAPNHFDLQCESHLHAGHAGSQGGGQHYALNVTSALFEGKTRVQRHQLIYTELADLLRSDQLFQGAYIHALKLQLSV